MANNVSTRVLLLLVAVLAASLVGLVTGWISWALDPSVGKALLAGGGAFGATLIVLLTAINFVLKREA
ncbi:hypothetical protein O7622_11300 [Micromonospora sp. WMMD1076]|uniref:hypothetical protein n=1 Tax=Micromonospora sp. WMMD1076 TaxID=3016103 RepID=UPI00249AC2D9|nr:hypothetical protein [Micromonospora sp. WMMD1076]WFF09096.1 hypothetical protein O7622_11300 [Micromonospora sp. WMMD1076]